MEKAKPPRRRLWISLAKCWARGWPEMEVTGLGRWCHTNLLSESWRHAVRSKDSPGCAASAFCFLSRYWSLPRGWKSAFLDLPSQSGEQEPLHHYYLPLYVWAFVPHPQDGLWEFPVSLSSPPLLNAPKTKYVKLSLSRGRKKKTQTYLVPDVNQGLKVKRDNPESSHPLC